MNLSKNDAELNNIKDIKEGRKIPHSHVGNVDNNIWKSEDCLNYVNSLDDNSRLNFSELARMFGLKDENDYGKDNKSQIVKEFLRVMESMLINLIIIKRAKILTFEGRNLSSQNTIESRYLQNQLLMKSKKI